MAVFLLQISRLFAGLINYLLRYFALFDFVFLGKKYRNPIGIGGSDSRYGI